MFNSCTQEQGEKFDAYLIKLRHLTKTCEYGALEEELLRDRIVTGTSDNNVQAWLLSESGLTLDRAIDICRSTEQAVWYFWSNQLPHFHSLPLPALLPYMNITVISVKSNLTKRCSIKSSNEKSCYYKHY